MSLITAFQPTRDPWAEIVRGSRQEIYEDLPITVMQDSQIDAMPATAAASLVVTSMFADKAGQTTNVDDKNRCVAGGLAFAL